jgi:hypothetical protein
MACGAVRLVTDDQAYPGGVDIHRSTAPLLRDAI